MAPEVLDKVYDPRSVEPHIYAQWERSGAFRSHPDGRSHERTFTIVIPPPNVTGALHLGHALNNTLQDILVRYHRMRGFNTLWQPGTDHAGIATQAVVERRIREQEGKTRHELGRDELVRRIWQWKDEYEARIISQLKLMGCSCDWERNRFTLDEGLAKAVRHMFFNLFRDGLIFRGKRLVNWDTQLQTAVSDDEVYYETVQGHFWHIKYPVIPDPSRDRQGAVDEPAFVVIATTRPETMLGDTAVAVHPDPEGYFARMERELKGMGDQLSNRSSKEAAEIVARLDALTERRNAMLPRLIELRDMALAGRKVMLPLVERAIPLICDEWADPLKGSGCVKITPAHDPNDYEVGLRHQLPMINVLTPDGRVARIVEADGGVNPHSADYEGLTFSSDGRAKVVADLEVRGLLEKVEDHEVEIGHSDRSKLPIEPFLSDQWFVKTGDVDGFRTEKREPDDADFSMGLLEEAAEPDPTPAKGLADAAMGAVTNGRIRVFPERYAKSYLDWLGEKRDWCISRQLWWGHRIPVWHARVRIVPGSHEFTTFSQIVCRGLDHALFNEMPGTLVRVFTGDSVPVNVQGEGIPFGCDSEEIELPCKKGRARRIHLGRFDTGGLTGEFDFYLCVVDDQSVNYYSEQGLDQDPDVLDTWFSSALWPFSTLGWPEGTPHLKQYYPGSVLCTSRDIITNWVARMVMFGLYAMGEVPFDHVYIHPKILDGRGETMSKSKGNGVDPVDIIHTHGADALRYTMADMTTETQDIRMPVGYICPHCSHITDQSVALKAEEQARKSRGEKLDRRLQPADCFRVTCTNRSCGKPFATQWADQAAKKELGVARETSDKFDIGRNFCNKLWNAARYAFMNLQQVATTEQSRDRKGAVPSTIDDGASGSAFELRSLPPEDRWILARLSETIRRYHQCLSSYQFSASVKELREFLWDALCDWYIELTKARLAEPPNSSDANGRETDDASDTGQIARQVLAFCMDQVLRLWHPTVPFITERLWQQLSALVPRRGLTGIVDLRTDSPLILAEFPLPAGYPPLDDEGILTTFSELQDATRGVREIRSSCSVPPKKQVTVTVVAPADHLEAFRSHAHIVRHMAGIGDLHVVSQAQRPPNAASVAVGKLHIYVHDVSDDAAERGRCQEALRETERQIEAKEKKLSNPQFVSHAKPEVVEVERTRLAELIARRESLRAHFDELDETHERN